MSDWNETVKAEIGVVGRQQFVPQKRQTRGDVEKRERRQKSRRWTAYAGLDALQRKVESRLERLESTNFGDALIEGDKEEDDNHSDDFEFDEESESEDDSMSDTDEEHNAEAIHKPTPKGKKKKPKKSASSNTKKPSSSKGSKKEKKDNKSKKPKRTKSTKRKVRTLADILLDENSRKLSASSTLEDLDAPDYFTSTAPKPRHPPKRLCAVFNVLAAYKDPESGLMYSNSKAFDQLKEQPPAWVRASANAPFHDAMRIINEERETLRRQLS